MKPLSHSVHFTGRVIRVTTDEVVLPNGHRAALEVVHHPGGAAAVAVDAEGRVWVSLDTPEYLASRHALTAELVAGVAGARALVEPATYAS